ncbi:MAG: TIGR02266 family protein [Polyangia bacterium]
MRQPITLKIKFKSASLDQFIERYSVDVSKGGIFIRTKEPLAIGTQLKFEFQLQDSSSLISGEGTVVWTREHDPARAGVAPGMGVRFDKLATASGTVLDTILVEKTRRGEAQVESRFDAGVRANASASGIVATRKPSDFEAADSRAGTPLPKPSPGFEGAEEEFREESTRVMQDDIVQRLAEKTRDKPASRDEAFSDEPTRARSAEEIDELVRGSHASVPSIDSAVREPKPAAIADVVPPFVTPAPVSSAPPPAVAPLTPPPAANDVVAPVVAAAQPLSDAKPTSAAETYREERPPTRAKSSSGGLGLLLGIGVLGAAAISYFVMRDKAPPQATVPAVVAAPVAETPPVAPAKPVAPPVPVGATVEVTSEPAGATILLDGTAQPGVTPTKLTGLDDKKTYDVTLSLKGYRDWKGKLSPEKDVKLETTLTANEKVVEVTSTPSGADVMLDGKKVGRTPFTIHKLDVAAPHKLALHHAGFAPAEVTVAATDAWEQKGDGRDVLAVTVPLTAEAAKPRTSSAPKHAPVAKPAAAVPALKLPEPPPTDTTAPVEKPVPEKPVVEKPAVEKPVEKPAPEKPVEKKPVDDDRSIKTPAFMKDKPADSTGEGAEAK